ncbi:protein SIP5 [Parastagonospora nodorum]|nr:protein SIP5 [Parastagonospora nodorum]KAH4071983.1 protein SIP5 [Parastagonospora nodorum]KAH4094867.1 protein SIP5 [Parastagonospora nodorum]KAH4130028.1 protein SIP5 [Parastagonospora nodorum]KAH4202513.1 protein SIP5 [Parastagonospora nodorum]
MGNSQGKEAQPASRGHTRRASAQGPASPSAAGASSASQERSASGVYSSRNNRGSTSFLGIGGSSEPRDPALEPRRETKAEREARKLEKERVIRAQEREKSLREEGVDGGYLVTLGVYTGPEDYSKPVVRQLQIERRLAPFWKGLNDHEDTWTEHQLVAVVNGRPLPAPDDIPPEEPQRPSNHLSPAWNPRGSESNLNNLTVPIGSRSMSQNSDRSNTLSPSHPAFSLPSPTSPIAANSSSSPFFRGRAKTLASLASGSRNTSQTDMAPQELNLPKDPYVNGQRIEAFLYKNAEECPICFMFYPPHLNKTRCCDQPICSECFVQIKRPDPHPPEHHGDAETPAPEPQEESQLVSEPAACPFCVQPEFGVTYEPPPFRRGLVYNQQGQPPLGSATSAMSSTSSLNSPAVTSPGRRRATSLAVNDKTVITTDMVRPDWAKKLSDARAHALRRAAAATALHNAAYMMGNISQHESRFALGRRRRTMFGSDSAGSSGQGTPRRDRDPSTGQAGEASNDLFPGRGSSRRGNRLDDLEDLMMMEAIRLSLAAEEERKRKDEKDAAKEAKKDGKKKAKELKKAAKAQSRIGSGFHPLDIDGLDESGVGSSSAAGKGKEVDRAVGNVGFNPMNEPTSTINTSSAKDDPQKHLETSRAQIQRDTSSSNLGPSDALDDQPSHRSALRNLSNASSSASSFAESYENSLRQPGQDSLAPGSIEPSPSGSGVNLSQTDTPPQGTPGTEPMFNFKSLADSITPEEQGEKDGGPQFIENVEGAHETSSKAPLASQSPKTEPTTQNKQPHDSGLADSTMTLKPTLPSLSNDNQNGDEIKPAPRIEAVQNGHSDLDSKQLGDVSMIDGYHHHATQ